MSCVLRPIEKNGTQLLLVNYNSVAHAREHFTSVDSYYYYHPCNSTCLSERVSDFFALPNPGIELMNPSPGRLQDSINLCIFPLGLMSVYNDDNPHLKIQIEMHKISFPKINIPFAILVMFLYSSYLQFMKNTMNLKL